MPQSSNLTSLDHSLGIQDPRIPCPNGPEPASEDYADLLLRVEYFQGVVPLGPGDGYAGTRAGNLNLCSYPGPHRH